jgi:hypothetical protein
MLNYTYVDAWDDYRRRLRYFWVALFGGFLALALLGYAADRLWGADWLVASLGVLWMGGFALSGFRLQLFDCPRCKGKFFKTQLGYWPFATKCMHCELPKWQTQSHAHLAEQGQT